MTAPGQALASEHALVLASVSAKARALQAAAAEDRWPASELRALTDCLQAEVLAQAAAEEAALFPAEGATPGIARLGRDHARLRAVAASLAHTAAGESPASAAQLAATARDLLSQLRLHFRTEQALLAARN